MKVPDNQTTLLRLAEEYGTPTYCYDLPRIKSQINLLKERLKQAPVSLLYAMKANASLPILTLFRDENIGIDAVSPAELELALRIGFRPESILFSANNMTDEEMEFAVRSGVTLNIGELSRLERFGRLYPEASVCLRFNPQIGAGHHEHVITAGERSKFGIPVADVQAVQETAALHRIRIRGIHQHIGSGILDTDTVWKAIQVLLRVADSFPMLEFINLGGGLGIPYRPEEQPLDLDRWEEIIVKPLRRYREQHPSDDLQFLFEPGRFFVAEAGVLIVRVNTLKRTSNRTFAGVDSGMGHMLRPAIYGAYHAVFNLSNPTGPPEIYDIVGNICESADFFARDRAVARIREQDFLAILDTGAYGMSMASEYNLRPLPGEIVLFGGSEEPLVIRKRESPQEMIDRLYPALSR